MSSFVAYHGEGGHAGSDRGGDSGAAAQHHQDRGHGDTDQHGDRDLRDGIQPRGASPGKYARRLSGGLTQWPHARL